jgi:hypothetical protein
MQQQQIVSDLSRCIKNCNSLNSNAVVTTSAFSANRKYLLVTIEHVGVIGDFASIAKELKQKHHVQSLQWKVRSDPTSPGLLRMECSLQLQDKFYMRKLVLRGVSLLLCIGCAAKVFYF